MKRSNPVIFGLLLGLLLAPVCLAQSDEDAIRELIVNNISKFEARDLDGIMEDYADGAVQLAANAPIREGKDAIRAAWEEDFAETDVDSEIEIHDVSVTDHHASARITFDDTSTNKATGEESRAVGNWLLVLHKTDDGWKIVQEVWNLQHPPNQPPG